MTVIWLSPRLPVDRAALAANLGPDVELSSAPLPPAGTSLAVATVFERPLIERLASVPGGGALLLLKPPGTATPPDLPLSGGPSTVVEATDVGEVTSAIRSVLTGSPTPWPATGLPTIVPSGWVLDAGEHPTGEFAAASAVPTVGRGRSRRNWLASGGIIGTAALAAIVVLATQGGAGTSQTGFRGPGGAFAGGYGSGSFPGGGLPGGSVGGYGLPGAGGAPGRLPNSGGSSGTDGTDDPDHAAQRQAFLDCLKKNGVDTSALSQGQRPRLDPSDPTMASVFERCRSLLPQRGDRDDDGDGEGMPPALGADQVRGHRPMRQICAVDRPGIGDGQREPGDGRVRSRGRPAGPAPRCPPGRSSSRPRCARE